MPQAGAERCDARQGWPARMADLTQHPQRCWPCSGASADGIQMAVRDGSLSCGNKCWEKHLMLFLGCDFDFL